MKRLAPGLAMMVAACAGPRVATAPMAAVQPPSQWRTAVPAGATLEQGWWNRFGDPALAALVDRAIVANSDVGIAVARIRDARAQEALARSALLPTFDAGAGVSRARTVNAFGNPSEQTAGQPQVQVAWEADLFGRLGDQVAAARAGLAASEAARDATRLSVAAATASGYITLRALDARLDVARATLAARATSLALIRRRTDAGYSPRLEQAQAEAEYQATAQIVPALQLAVTRQENALRLLLGETPGGVARGLPLSALVEPPVPAFLPAELLRRRPDVAQAEFQLASTDSALAAARKRFLPQVRLSASAGAAFSTLLADPITLWSVGGSILAPLFEGGRLTAQAESAAAQRDLAAFAYRRAALTAFREADDAMGAVLRTDEQVRVLSAQRDALAEAFRLAANRYREGYSPLLEQLDAQRGLLAAELALIQARADALSARVTLYQALGGGWDGLEP
ncbi:MAG: hypothetical protein RIS94_1410 [Pseudomonadota bacterium]